MQHQEQVCAHIHTSQGEGLIDDYSWQLQHYSQQYLALPITGSRLKCWKLCRCSSTVRVEQTAEIFLRELFSTWKFPDLQYACLNVCFMCLNIFVTMCMCLCVSIDNVLYVCVCYIHVHVYVMLRTTHTIQLMHFFVLLVLCMHTQLFWHCW